MQQKRAVQQKVPTMTNSDQSSVSADRYAHLQAPGPARPFLEIVTPVVEDLGYDLLRIRMTGDNANTVLQVMAVGSDGTMTVDGCEKISRGLSAVLDVEDPIKAAYVLEVSSPGMARPLCRPRDFSDWIGLEAKLELKNPIDGQKRFRGRLAGFEDGEALLQVALDGYDEPQILGFKIEDIAESRLVANDEMMQASLKASKGKG
ncbi:MAG: ribosome maturation factor RimP [Parvibaculales bacterium]